MVAHARNTRLAPEAPDLVWFRGPDTVRFLNDIISQEIASLEPGAVVRSLLLGPDGKLAHQLWVLRGDAEVGLVTDEGRGSDLASVLGRYRIRVDVDIQASEEPVWLVMGERSVKDAQWERAGDIIRADLSWRNYPRTLVTGPRPDFIGMSEQEYELARIEAGEPKWGVDVDETTIPHESGLVPETVDFTKGCFLGQELVARIDSRGGNVPRHLRLLEIGDLTAEPGAPLTAQGTDVGRLTSRAGPLALALVKRGIQIGDVVEVGRGSATVRDLRSGDSA